MQQRIPIFDADWTFYAYRRSDVELTEDDRPTGMTYRPDPEPRGGGIQGPQVIPTHLIINGLSKDWEISPRQLDPSEVEGNPNHAVWECLCSCPTGGTVTTSAPYMLSSNPMEY